jgi:hypothetical protein
VGDEGSPFRLLREITGESARQIGVPGVSMRDSVFVPGAARNAQSTGGRIRGTVTDNSGASSQAPKSSLINQGTNAVREAQSGASGEYLFLEVAVGHLRS